MAGFFDPTLYGTFGDGWDNTTYTWSGANKSAGYARITKWAAVSGSAAGASDDLGVTSNKFPVVSGIFGQHLSFGVLYNDRVDVYRSSGGTTYNAGSTTGVGFLAVLAAMNGTTNVTDTNPEAIVYIGAATANSGCVGLGILPQTRELVVFGANPTVAITAISVANPSIISAAAHGLTTGQIVYPVNVSTTPQINLTDQVVTVIDANSFSVPVNVTAVADGVGVYAEGVNYVRTGLYLPASPTAVGFKHTSTGWTLKVQGVGTATGTAICTISWPSASGRISFGSDLTDTRNLSKWSGGGVYCCYRYTGSTLATGTNMADGCSALQALYDPTTKTKLLTIGGTSLMAGAWQHEGEGIAGHIAEQLPDWRVICVAAGGATSTQVAAAIANSTASGLYAGMTPTRKVALFDSCYANDAIAATGSPNMTTYATKVGLIASGCASVGFQCVFEPALPISNADTTDANVVAYETNRLTANTTLRAISSAIVASTDSLPAFSCNLTGSSTNAAKATVIRNTTRNRYYEIPDNGVGVNDPTSLITCDETHTGHIGTRVRAAKVVETANANGSGVFVGSVAPRLIPFPVPC